MGRRRQLTDVLVQARQARRLSQSELARRINVSNQQVSRWERGAARPGRDNIRALAETLGLDAGELLALAFEAQGEELSEIRRDRDELRALLIQAIDEVRMVAADVRKQLEESRGGRPRAVPKDR